MEVKQLAASTSCLAGHSLEDAIAQIRRLGFGGLGFLAFGGSRQAAGELPGFWFRSMGEPERRRLQALVKDFQYLHLHSPFVDLPLFSYDPRVQQLSLDRVEEAVEAAGYLGAGVVTVHVNPRPHLPIHLYWDDVVNTLRRLGEFAAMRGVRIGVETGFPDSVDLFVDLLEAVGHHAVGATLDTGHVVRYVEPAFWGTPEGVEELNRGMGDLIRQLGPLILHCHVNDVRASDWRDHRAIGRGVIDFEVVLAGLHALDYPGALELEIEEKDQVAALTESKRRLEQILRKLNRGGAASREKTAA